MNARARRLPWPRTLSARLLLVLLGGLILAHALSFGLLFYERYQSTRSMMLRNLDEDAAVSVALLEHLPADQRQAWVPRLERRTYRYLLRPAQAGPALETDRARQVTAIIDDSLEHRYPLQARQVARLPERFEVELRLHDGSPLTIEVTPSGLPLARWLPAVLLVQLALLLVCAWLAVRLALRPLRQLSHAVEQLQPGKDAPMLPEVRPRRSGHGRSRAQCTAGADPWPCQRAAADSGGHLARSADADHAHEAARGNPARRCHPAAPAG
jgi:HAMP domain.